MIDFLLRQVRFQAIRHSCSRRRRHRRFGHGTEQCEARCLLAADITFGDPLAMDVDVNPEDVLVADFNGDGLLDLAVASKPSSVLILINSGDGTFNRQQYQPLPANPSAVELADATGDGRVVLVLTMQGYNLVGILPNYVAGDANTDGVFDPLDIVHVLQAGLYRTGDTASWAEGDWNGDSVFDQLDIVRALQAGRYSAGR